MSWTKWQESTQKTINKELLGIYDNPDDIEKYKNIQLFRFEGF